MITVEKAKNKVCIWNVLLDKKIVGEIRFSALDVNYRYFSKGQKVGGDPFDSLKDVIASLGD
jgi:hypothetical protein